MAEEVRRQVVSDPLAVKAIGQTPDRSLSLGGMRRPVGGDSDIAYQDTLSGFAALGNIQKAVAGIVAAKRDEFVAQGKMDYMTGVTEEQMLRTGNKYTQQGYETLSSIDQASTWYQNELLAIDETTRDMSPQEYKSYLMEKRKQALSNLPDDPAVRKIYVAAFEEYGPRLANEHFKAHNERNRTKNIYALSNAAYSSAGANEDASRVMPGGPLRVSPGIVSPTIHTSAEDRDVGIRTMLGEAGGEGEFGMAAVAHVLKNRAIDGAYGGRSIRAVALAPKQFSAWNDGPGGIPAIRNYSPNSKAYQRAAKVYDAVMSGHHADPTNGATHYYSPKGMKLLVASGSQSNLVPNWWDAQAAKGQVTIGNHRFAGKANGLDGFTASGFQPRTGETAAQLVDKASRLSIPHGGTAEAIRNEAVAYQNPLTVIETDTPQSVAEAEGVALTYAPGKSQLRRTFENSHLRDEDKAAAATDAMIRSLEEGSDQVYNDLGGEAFLRSLGADESDINAVQAARAKQLKGQQDRFNVDAERKTEDLRSAVKAGEFQTVDEVLQAVKGLQDELGQDEQWAKSLANETLKEWHKVTDDDAVLNPDLASDLAGIQRLMAEEPNFTAEQAVNAAVLLGQYYDIDGKTVQGWITDMWRRDAVRKDKLVTEMAAEQKKVEKENLVKAQVESALKQNSGLKSIKGNVRINKNGHEVEVTAQEYAVQLLKDREVQNAQSMIEKKGPDGKPLLDPNRADALVNKTVYEKLAKHGVVDTEHGEELTGALRGDFTTKDGKVSEDAVKAFDFWLQMKKNPNVGPEYMAQMITDKDVRTLLNSAELMYSGRLDIEGALRKAHLRISQGADMEARIGMNEKFQAQVGAGVDKVMDELMADPWFQFDAFTSEQRAQVNTKRAAYREDVIRRANGYHVQNPMVDPEAHIKMAVEDFKNDAIVVGGNLVLGSHTEGKRLDQVMGVESLGKDAPQRALNAYMAEFGEDLFPNLLTGPGNAGRTQSWRSFLLNMAWDSNLVGATINSLTGMEQLDGSRDTPMYNVEYNSTMGTLEIQLWKDGSMQELIGKPKYVNADEVGKYWLESQKEAPTGFGILRRFKEDLSTNTINQQGSDAGSFVGSLVKPQ